MLASSSNRFSKKSNKNSRDRPNADARIGAQPSETLWVETGRSGLRFGLPVK